MPKTVADLRALMGDLPCPDQPISCKVLKVEDRDTFYLERLVLDLNGYEPVPALFMRPKGGKGPYPAVLFNHSHGNLFHIGKTELLDGCEYMLKRGYAYDLAERGIAALCIDHMCFEDRSGLTESYVYKKLIWDGYVMWSWMVYDSLRALDYLCMREDVDSMRIATIGMSMGSTMAQWVAALDGRIKVCVDICCMTNFDELLRENRLDQHGIYYYVPGLHRAFGVADINALIAPRAHLSIAGTFDPHTPLKGLEKDNKQLCRVYEECGKPQNWCQKLYPIGHTETYEMRFDVLAFLNEHL